MKVVNLIFGIIIFFVIVGNVAGILNASDYGDEISYPDIVIYLAIRIGKILILWGIVVSIVWIVCKLKNRKSNQQASQ